MSKHQGKAGCPPLYRQKLKKKALFLTQPQIDYMEKLVQQGEFKSSSQIVRHLLEAVI